MSDSQLIINQGPSNSVGVSLKLKVIKIFQNIAFFGLLLLIFLTAIPYGTTDERFKMMFVFGCCFLAIFRITESFLRKELTLSNKLFFSPLLGIVALAFLQIIPFNFFAGDVFRTTISMNVYETKIFILLFFSLLVAAEILFTYTTTNQRIQHLIYHVFTVSIGSALFGFLRIFIPNFDSLFPTFLINEKVKIAQFINPNHFTYLMEMNLGLLIGLQLKAKLVSWQRPFYWIMSGFTFFGIIYANSRGGILSIAGMGVFGVCLYFLTSDKMLNSENIERPSSTRFSKYSRLILATVLVSSIFFGIMVLTVAFVGGDPVVSRLETVRNEVIENSDGKIRRLVIWQSTIELIRENPVFGIGFGAYPVAITAFDKASGDYALKQAHNDYLEVLANGGIVGFILMLVFIGLLIKKISVQIVSYNHFRQASCFGATIGIFGVMIHSFVEFGLHTLVNALIFTVLIVIATANINTDAEI